MQRHLYPNSMSFWNEDQVSIESDWNEKEYCWNVIYIGLTENQVFML